MKRLRASSRSDGTRRTMRSGMMSPMQMTSTTSDQLGCHASRKYRSMQYSTPIAIRPTAPMHIAMEERRDLLPSRSRKLDEIEQKVEAGKRPYQKILLALLTAGITLLVGMVLSWLLL